MRGTILYPPQSIPSSELGIAGQIIMSFREWCFWMWRVRSISAFSSGSLSGRKRGFADPPDITSGSYSNNTIGDYPVIKTPGVNPEVATEADQFVGPRRNYANSLGFGIFESISEDSGSSYQFTFRFGGSGFHRPDYPETEGWVMNFDIGLIINVFDDDGNPLAAASVSNVPQSPSLPYSATLILFGLDPLFGSVYQHVIPLYWSGIAYVDEEGGAGATGGSALFIAQPSGYYEWKNQDGFALYNGNTGQLN
jgi:hypothetical protein